MRGHSHIDVGTLTWHFATDREGEAFQMHRLVNLCTLKWLELQNEKLKWQERALRLLAENFPSRSVFETREICALYLPHVINIIDSLSLSPDHVNELSLLVDTAYYLQSQGDYRVAEQMIRTALELYEKTHGNEHPDTLRSMTILGEVLIHQGSNDRGKYDEAEKLHRKLLMLRERTLGEEDESTLSAIGSLAGVLMRRDKYEEAKELLEQNVKLPSELLGENTLTDKKRLAAVYRYLHQLSKAEELQVQSLEKRKMVGEVESRCTLWSVRYSETNQLNKAVELEVQVLEAYTKLRGKFREAEHLDTLLGMANLAATYYDLNRLTEAQELQTKVFRAHNLLLGPYHPPTLLSLNSAHMTESKVIDAGYQLVVLQRSTRDLGEKHPYTLLSMANTAAYYYDPTQLDRAEELGVQALRGREEVLGATHRDTLFSMAILAVIYKDSNRPSEAAELQVQLLEKRQKVLGAEHRETLSSMAGLAVTYEEPNRLSDAEELQVHVLEKRKRVLGAEHPHTLLSMVNLAWTWKKQHHIDQAIS